MNRRILIAVIAPFVLNAGIALAQDAPPPGTPMSHRPWHMSSAEMAKHHAEMCTDRYARAVGGMASLEVKLAITSEQRPLFKQWKDVVLSDAKARSTACSDMKMPEKKPSLIEHLQRAETMMQSRVDALKAQMPTLEKLDNALNGDQKKVLEHAVYARLAWHHGGAMAHHFIARRDEAHPEFHGD
ncbi:MAG: Spy/CpxP family protein refolding chaperone [Alphaproteobacteria bacterium]|nr:Spy/CpxP family protein refolding chaperone [Alphaproteobacteria bacterium]MDE2014553.1 Spy/CpxP family protein refolding chaperone [Alphaproteobacteria bacterium]MDE2074769.1 Spy/CpxP family protein refolding chaperone [Alphaproteobacteria bacterium]MDE2352881.1 Spy/CpxP family protein refolding chaperone [Alphaproteobacteria bacterium]